MYSKFPSLCSLPTVISFLIPAFYALVLVFCVVVFPIGLSDDGFHVLKSSQEFMETYSYRGYIPIGAPPLYVISISFLGIFFELERAARVISLLSGVGILSTIPFITKKLELRVFSGLLLQSLLVLNPTFLQFSLRIDNHFFNVFFLIMVFLFGVDLLKHNESWPTVAGFIIFGSLACLSRFRSWAVIFLVLIVYCLERKRGRAERRAVMIGSAILLINGVWFFYTWMLEGILVSKYVRSGFPIGFAMAQNGVFPELSGNQWFLSRQFFYTSVFDLIWTHPHHYLRHVGINITRFLRMIIYDFPLLNYLSITIGLGVVLSFLQFDRSEHKLINLVFLGFLLFSLLIRFQWENFIFPGILMSTVGLSWVISWSAHTIPVTLRDSRFTQIGAAGIIVFSMVTYSVKSVPAFQALADRDFREYRHPKKILGRNLNRLIETKATDAKKLKIMTSHFNFSIFRELGYLEDFILVLSPVPRFSAKDFFCYQGLTDAQLQFYSKLNQPMNLDKNMYVPPDYFLLTPMTLKTLRSRSSIDLSDFYPLISEIRWWKTKGFYRLYKVKASKLPC